MVMVFGQFPSKIPGHAFPDVVRVEPEAEKVDHFGQGRLGSHVHARDHSGPGQGRTGLVASLVHGSPQALGAVYDHHAAVAGFGQDIHQVSVFGRAVAHAVGLENQALQWRSKHVAHQFGRDARKEAQGSNPGVGQGMDGQRPGGSGREYVFGMWPDGHAYVPEVRIVRGIECLETGGVDLGGAAAAQEPVAEAQADFRDGEA